MNLGRLLLGAAAVRAVRGSGGGRSSSSGTGTGCLIGVVAVIVALGMAWEWAKENPVPSLIGFAVVSLLVIAYLRSRRPVPQVRIATLDGFLALTPTQFEQEVAALFRALGYPQMDAVGGAGDLSVDVRGVDPQGRTVLVQCKRYAPDRRIGSPEIQQFYGMARYHDANAHAVFITTSGYTDAAIDVARQVGVELIDGPALVSIAGKVNQALAQAAARQASGAEG